jgi:hypothetical protein
VYHCFHDVIKILFSLKLHILDTAFLLIIEFLHLGACIVFHFLLLYITISRHCITKYGFLEQNKLN